MYIFVLLFYCCVFLFVCALLMIHGKCTGMRGSMNKVIKTFVCRGCMNPVTVTACTSVDIGVNANMKLLEWGGCLDRNRWTKQIRDD